MADSLLNVSKSTLTEFMDALEAKLALITNLVDYKQIGLTLKDIRRPMLIVGLPGIGKTCGIISIIEKLNLKLPEEKKLGFKKILLGQTVVGSMSGIPVVMPDGTVKRVQVPDLPDPERDGEYGVLFLDEITTADEAQVQPALGLTDDSRNIGTYTLPEHWIVVGAGNGPDCSNFVRLDDMTISRFEVYDIAYDFQEDWRPYAQSHGIEDNIIAFLSFDPSACVRVESTDMDDNGKLFACPRTWERLSHELKMRKAIGKEVRQDDIGRFAGRIVGVNAARHFQAFCATIERLDVSPEKIVNGEERDPSADMKKEVFFAVLQSCTKLLTKILDEHGDGEGNFDTVAYSSVGNTLSWFLKMQDTDLEATVNAMMSFKTGVPNIQLIFLDSDFPPFCPEFNDFLENYGTMMLNQQSSFDLKF